MMKRPFLIGLTILLTSSFLVILTAAKPAGTQKVRFVGITSVEFNGSKGVLTFNGQCHIDFPDSRMCTTQEVITGVDPAVIPFGTRAWVQPVILTGTTSDAIDFSGRWFGDTPIVSPPANPSLSCLGWSAPAGSTGLSLSGSNPNDGSHGQILLSNCDFVNAVACCR